MIFYKMKEGKENVITDYGVLRLERLLKLREIALKDRNITKLKQAAFLITTQTEILNSRYHHQNQFNFN